jgi:hypothetical protein
VLALKDKFIVHALKLLLAAEKFLLIAWKRTVAKIPNLVKENHIAAER